MNIDVLKDLSPAEPASAGDLPPFGLFAAGVYPFLEFRWFHEAYYRVLEAFAAGRVRRLIVTMPPQHGKSVGASTLLPAYLLGRNPDLRIAIASYSASLASKFNRRVQRIIDSPEYAAFFPETTIKRGARPPEYLRTADEVEIIGHRGGLLSVGREGALTGNRVDCFILDDLYKNGIQLKLNAVDFSPLPASESEEVIVERTTAVGTDIEGLAVGGNLFHDLFRARAAISSETIDNKIVLFKPFEESLQRVLLMETDVCVAVAVLNADNQISNNRHTWSITKELLVCMLCIIFLCFYELVVEINIIHLTLFQLTSCTHTIEQ